MFDADETIAPDTSDPDTSVLAALLAWYREMGVDEAVGAGATDWLVHGAAAPGAALRERLAANSAAAAAVTMPPSVTTPVPASPHRSLPAAGPAAGPGARPGARPAPVQAAKAASPVARNFPTSAPDVSQTAARAAAGSAQSLAELEAALRAFDGCGLKATAKNLCFYRGAERARVMLIGEAPGRDEDQEGRPFAGPTGQLLDRMLASIALTEADVHITNIVYWRPPGNRTPTAQEAAICKPFLDRQIALVQPEFVIPLGGTAAKHILTVAEGIMRVRGRWHAGEFGGRSVRVLPTLHPAYLLRTPAAKRLAWRDLLSLKSAL